MHQLIDRKLRIIFYLFLLSILATINNYSKKDFFENSILKISKIKVTGLDSENNLKIKKNLQKTLTQNIFFLKKENIKNILNKYNEIETFEIKKEYPNTIEVKIKKIEFIGITKKNDQKFLIGSNGKIISYKSNESKKLNLPYVYGENFNENFIVFFNLVKKSKLSHKIIKSYYYFPSNRWDLKIKNDVIIKLPNKNLTQALEIIPKLINKNNFNSKIIDLRIEDQIIITDE
jgi:cell division protein FtsQ